MRRRVRLGPRDLHAHLDIAPVVGAREARVRLLRDDEDDVLERPVAPLVADARDAQARVALPPGWDVEVDVHGLRAAVAQRARDAVPVVCAEEEVLEREREWEDPVFREVVLCPRRAERVEGHAEVDHLVVLILVFVF